MPKKVPGYPYFSDQKVRDAFSRIKPDYRINEDWLKAQRLRLMGAIEMAEEGRFWRRFTERMQLWWEELPYLWLPARPVLAWSAAIVIGILIGRYLLVGPISSQPMLAADGSVQISQTDLAEAIRTGQVKNIKVRRSDDPNNPVELNVTMGQEVRLTGSAEREDVLAALEYVLVRDLNPGQRLESARILGSTAGIERKESTVLAMVSALLTDENPGVRLSIIKSLRGSQAPMVKDALIKTLLEDESEAVRLAAIDNLVPFLDDLSARSALLLVSRMDPMENVRYQAYKVLSMAPEDNQDDERLDSLP